jgi:hypothetical protein
MEVEEYGVKKSWDGWRTFAYVRDGTPMGLMPITWANELFKTKQQANVFIKDLATKMDGENDKQTLKRHKEITKGIS